MEKYHARFDRDYMVTNWPKFGAQIKKFLNLSLDFEDLQYLAIEFLLDDDSFLTGSEGGNGAGHHIPALQAIG